VDIGRSLPTPARQAADPKYQRMAPGALLPYLAVSTRWLVLTGLYLLFGVLGGLYLWGSTSIGADHATYQRAADALWSTGDPYQSAALYPEDYRFRYPPLLAMIFPVLGWPPLWFALITVATAIPIYVGWRQAGPAGLLPAALLVGAWGQQLLNGNAQAFVVALLAVVPFTGAWGAMGLALATMLKLHPALALVWYVGRREWRLVVWYLVGLAVLTVVQLPFLGPFLNFYLNDPVATQSIPGMSLRVLGVIPWVAIIVAVAAAALLLARTRYGWLLATVLQLVALPRVLLVNLALLLAAPLPGRAATRARPAPATTAESAGTQ
jgi:hypothetical protein